MKHLRQAPSTQSMQSSARGSGHVREAVSRPKGFYQQLGIAAPTIFAYEQPLIDNKRVQAFDGSRKLVQRMTADGLRPTPIGIEYFKYNRHSFRVEYPVRTARPIGNNARKVSQSVGSSCRMMRPMDISSWGRHYRRTAQN